ncbi:MAG: cohesin domain-containing protein [Bacteroidales bacterium]|nr:cohesin domain-containing protein [Bacteroidales bacterium]MDZ4204241.1 cohesin domain-containing protein [Bacteroidales bacterium]
MNRNFGNHPNTHDLFHVPKASPFAFVHRMALLVIIFSFNYAVAGSNILKLDSVQTFPSQSVTINIIINNEDPFISFQVDIPLPPDFSYVTGSVALNPARKVDHTISTSLLQGNVLRVLSYSPANKLFLGNNGSIATIKLTAAATPGNHVLLANNVVIGDPQAINIVTGTLSGAVNVMGTLFVAVSATPDNICTGDAVQLNAVISGGGWFPLFYWSSVPAGFISGNPSPVVYPQQNTQYLLSVFDGYQIASGTNSVVVVPLPVVFAGIDRFVHAGNSLQITGASAQHYNTLSWHTDGDGLFNNPALLHPTYTPGLMDIANGVVSFILSATANPPCNPAQDNMTLHILRQNDNVMTIQGDTAYLNDTITISIGINNKHAFSAFTCTIQFPSQMPYLQGSAQLSGRETNHELSAAVNGNLLSLQSNSPTNSPFSGNQGTVLRCKLLTGNLQGQFPLIITQASVFEPLGSDILTSAVNGQVTLIISGRPDDMHQTNPILELTRHPETGKIALRLHLTVQSNVLTELFDLTGRCISMGKPVSFPAGVHLVALDTMMPEPGNRNQGLYLLRVSVQGSVPFYKTFKLINTMH